MASRDVVACTDEANANITAKKNNTAAITPPITAINLITKGVVISDLNVAFFNFHSQWFFYFLIFYKTKKLDLIEQWLYGFLNSLKQ